MLTARWKVRPETVVDRLERRADAAADRAMRRVGERVAEAARDEHPYTDRTGDLTASIKALDPAGQLSSGTLREHVVATEPYAGFVEDNPTYEFLGRAFDRVAGELEDIADAEFERIE